jgi:hypothetical protein
MPDGNSDTLLYRFNIFTINHLRVRILNSAPGLNPAAKMSAILHNSAGFFTTGTPPKQSTPECPENREGPCLPATAIVGDNAPRRD